MGKVIKCHNRSQSRLSPYPAIPAQRFNQEKADWEQAVCSVCLEAPHNAVLLLCSCHEKGCRPYMCGTNIRHSNCLELFKKSYSKPLNSSNTEDLPLCKNSEPAELCCPLCRGQVLGWTVVKPARQHLNKKKRSCMHEACSFKGSYHKLKKHVKEEHRLTKARKVDPALEEKWKALQSRTEREDVLSTIRSSMPRSVVIGDYVIDMGGNGNTSNNNSFGGEDDYFDEEDDDDDDDMFENELFGGRGHGTSINRSFLNFLIQRHARHSNSSSSSSRANRRGQRRSRFLI